MRIPRVILSTLSKMVDVFQSRYALECLQIERSGSELFACATNGRRLIAATWKEDKSDEGSTNERTGLSDEKKRGGFSVLLPGEFAAMLSACCKPGSVILDEIASDEGVVIKLDNGEKTMQIRLTPSDGQFPKWRDSIGIPSDPTSFSVRSRQLGELLIAMSDLIGEDAVVTISVGREGKPVHVCGSGHGIRAVGLAAVEEPKEPESF